MDAPSPRPRSLLLLLSPYLLIALLFACMDVLAMRRASELRAETRYLVEDMLADVETAGRMGRELDRVKLLTDQHVYDKESTAMQALEARIGDAWQRYDSAAAQYGARAMQPWEDADWRRLGAAIAEIRPGIDGVLELSRLNDDQDARGALVALERPFEGAHADLRHLIEGNERAANETVARVEALQRSSTSSMQAVALAGVALSVAVGAAMTRVLRRREDRLRDAATKLEGVNRELDAFSHRVAHDLKNPLTTAELTTQRLALRCPSAELANGFARLLRALRRIGAIIDDLAALSRMSSEPVTACDPAAVVEELRADLEPCAQSGGVSLVIDVDPASVRCGLGLLRQVLWNLADNAIKYRRPAGEPRVEIRGHAVDGQYELLVRDNGVGIAPDETCKVFEPFFRASGAEAAQGTGLGLSIVKRAVEASGGSVSVTSEPGAGSSFVTRLPLAAAR